MVLIVHQASERDDSAEKFEAYARRAALLAEADQLRAKLRDSQLAVFRSEAKNRKEVLRKLGHIDDEGGTGLDVVRSPRSSIDLLNR